MVLEASNLRSFCLIEICRQPHLVLQQHRRRVHQPKFPTLLKRRLQSENPLAQSVPNFPDLRKENTKLYSGVGKVTTRSQVRNNPCSKTSSEEIPLVKEEKPRRSNSLRKNSAGPVEFSDMLPLDSDGVVLAPLKFDKEQISVESKPFLRNGNGIGPGTGASIAKLKASFAADNLANEEESDEFFEAEDSADVAKDDDEEELETTEVEESIDMDMDNGKPRPSHESDKLGNSESENGYSLRSLSQADLGSAVELPAAVPSAFHASKHSASFNSSPSFLVTSFNGMSRLVLKDRLSFFEKVDGLRTSVPKPDQAYPNWQQKWIYKKETEHIPRQELAHFTIYVV